ncbi:hypothetical protein QOZ80_4AG0324760 [Eleusine coracana subsp. coracana]|nr:hypothetical protein QOZ80_4AG0324760 [Eleusine coracana subsp. coracana]
MAAKKSTSQASLTSSALALSGEITPANQIVPTNLDLTLAEIVEPLAIEPPLRREEERAGRTRFAERRSPSATRTSQRALSPTPARTMKTRGTSPVRRPTPDIKRPTTGTLAHRKTTPTRRLHNGDPSALLPREHLVETLQGRDGSPFGYMYRMDYIPTSPEQKGRFTSTGPRTGPGKGKVLFPKLTSEDKREMEESIDSSPQKTISRFLDPPPITAEGGHYQDSGDEATGPSKAKLAQDVLLLRAENKRLANKLAEELVDRAQLEDRVQRLEEGMKDLRRGLCAKMERICSHMGEPDLYKGK